MNQPFPTTLQSQLNIKHHIWKYIALGLIIIIMLIAVVKLWLNSPFYIFFPKSVLTTTTNLTNNLLSNCSDKNLTDQSKWRTIDIKEITIKVPRGLNYIKEQGLDSNVWSIKGCDLSISFDLGMYGGKPSTQDMTVFNEVINDRQHIVTISKLNGSQIDNFISGYVGPKLSEINKPKPTPTPFSGPHELTADYFKNPHLTIYAEFKDEKQKNILVPIFKTIRLKDNQ